MSRKALKLALKSNVKTIEQHILIRLADRANKETLKCSLSIKNLCSDTGYSKSTVIRTLTSLEGKGFIDVERTKMEDGENKVNTYKLNEFYNR